MYSRFMMGSYIAWQVIIFLGYDQFTKPKSQSRFDEKMAEVGIYQGDSAKIIYEVKGKKKLHLFDSFTGLPLHICS